MNAVLIALAGSLGLILTAILTYLVARRQTSGSTKTSDAETIFAASEALRKEQRDVIVGLQIEHGKLQERIESLNKELFELRVESKTLRLQVDELRTENAMHKTERAFLQKKLEEHAVALSLVNRDRVLATLPTTLPMSGEKVETVG